MQEKFDVLLPTGFVIPENKVAATRIIEHLFDSQGLALSDLISALQYENKPKFGPSAISNIRLEVAAYDASGLNGRLRVLYDMQLTFGCEDAVKNHLDQHSYYNFKFVPMQALLHFESDAIEIRSTSDEF
jgi:hypothetical protein